jgi:hypothetical protein
MQESFESPEISDKTQFRRTKLASFLYKPVVLLLSIIVVGISIVAPFYLSRYERGPGGQTLRLILTHDMVMHLPLAQAFDKVLRTGILYPRWLADINHGYGIATMNYYPPIVYYLISLFHAIFGNWVDGLFALSILAFAGSGLSLYLFARLFLGSLASAVASLFYMLLPFHMLTLYWQGAMGQLLSYVFLPLVLYFVYKLGKQGQARNYAAVGLFYGLFLLTNFPIAFLFSYTLVFYALVWAGKRREWKIVLRIAIGMALGLLFSAIYWLPAALETKYMYEWTSELFPYHTTYMTLLTVHDEFGWRLNTLFALHLVVLTIAIIIVRAVASKEPKATDVIPSLAEESSFQIRLWVIMSIATIFMSTSFSIYISKLIPRIQLAVPAWRWLVPAGFFTALLIGAAFERLINSAVFLPKRRLLYSAVFGIALVGNVWFSVQYILIGALSNPTYVPASMYIDSGFTPKGSTSPDRLPDTPQALLQPETGTVRVIRWDPQDREIFVQAAEPVALRLRTYNFPGWVAHIDGQKTPVLSDKDGAQLIEVPEGSHTVEVSFVNTPPRTYGTILSGFGFLTIISLTALSQWQRNKRRVAERAETAVYGDESEAGNLTDGEKVERRSLTRRKKQIAIIGIAILAGILMLVVFNRVFRTDKKPAPSNNSATQKEAPAIGSEAKLQVQGLALIPVAVDDTALNELMGVLPSRDADKLEGLVQAGKVLRVDNGTRVRILEFGFAKTKIRILEGEHSRKDGWVPERWLQ